MNFTDDAKCNRWDYRVINHRTWGLSIIGLGVFVFLYESFSHLVTILIVSKKISNSYFLSQFF